MATRRGVNPTYPAYTPFDHDTAWPEYPFAALSTKPNHIYQAVREALHLAGFYPERFGTVGLPSATSILPAAAPVVP